MHMTLVLIICIVMKLQNLKNSSSLQNFTAHLDQLMTTRNIAVYSYMQGLSFVDEAELKLLVLKFQ